jgi:large subunit ribosomal protein L21
MYVVFQTGGKQYRASEGDLVRVERLEGPIGGEVLIDKVLMVGSDQEVRVGTPYVANAQVLGRIVEQDKGPKIIIFKHKRRKGYRRKTGHRQPYTCVKVDRITV